MTTMPMSFDLPDSLNATKPPEHRGVRRDRVKMMVLNKNTGGTIHDIFYHLDRYLVPGDLLVLNNSRTLPAVLKGNLKRGVTRTSIPNVEVRLAHKKSMFLWEAFILNEETSYGDRVQFSKNLYATVKDVSTERPFVTLEFSLTDNEFFQEIYAIGKPVKYEYIHEPLDLDDYQTVFATAPGSMEMPSAGRAFSWEMLFRLKRLGVRIAYLQLHTGLTYLSDNRWDQEPTDNIEEYTIPADTARVVNETKQAGGRVIAVGTTVVRALESAVNDKGILMPKTDLTNLHIDKTFPLQTADGLITGFHEPKASHLDLLSAFISDRKLYDAYQVALNKGYLWHEFGDINVIL